MSTKQTLVALATFKWLVPLLLSCLGGLLLVIGLGVVRSQLAAEVYERRLTSLLGEYATLRERYNAAVTRTAVTELMVEGGEVSVRVRTAAGVVKTVPVPVDPTSEVYVDYIVHDGRLWIRRVFDAKTAPEKATVIDPAWAHLDWRDAKIQHGKAVYRQLDEGCWIITVTGGGALGLMKSERVFDDVELVAAPSIEEFKQSVETARDDARQVGVGDVVRHLLGRGR